MSAGDDLHRCSSGEEENIFAAGLIVGKRVTHSAGRALSAIRDMLVRHLHEIAFMMAFNPNKRSLVLVLVASTVLAGHWPAARAEAQRISPSVLPEALRQQWNDLRPSFNENSRCAAVWDAGGEAAKQSLKCSIYMRMGSEAERRALMACEEFRQEHRIRAACRLITP